MKLGNSECMCPDNDIANLKEKFKGNTLLVVDDSVELRQLIVRMFKTLGFNTIEAESGRKAFAAFKQNKIDGVLSDIRMPDGDGIELLENIRSLDPNLPIVVLMSGFCDVTIEEAIKKGAVTILNKPLKGKVIVTTVIKAMNDALLSLDMQAEAAVSGGQLDVLKSLVEKDQNMIYKFNSF